MEAPESPSLDVNSLTSLMEERNIKNFKQMFKDLNDLARNLRTDLKKGLGEDEITQKFAWRIKAYGSNVMPSKPPKGFFSLLLSALNNNLIIVLILSALFSIVLGFLSEQKSHNIIEGSAILAAVVIVAFVTAINDYNKEKQFRKLNAIKDDTQVPVIRAGEISTVSTRVVQVGDIVVLEQGAKICADGILIEGDELKVDESSMTGESDSVRKSPDTDPFLLSGCQILEGRGTMLVLAVGPHSQVGQAKSLVLQDFEQTPLEENLDHLASTIGKMGMVSAVLTFITLFSQYVKNHEGPLNLIDSIEHIVDYLIEAITIVVVAVPEGLPLAVTISLAYSMFEMMKDKNLVRHLAACETMGGVTTICSDKTGTLTQNKMTVVKGWIGNTEYINLTPPPTLPPQIQSLLCYSVISNSSARVEKKTPLPIQSLTFETLDLDKNNSISKEEFEIFMNKINPKDEIKGNKTECALLEFIHNVYNLEELRRQSGEPLKIFPFSSTRKSMVTILKPDNFKKCRAYIKGAPELILKSCSQALDRDGNLVPINHVSSNADARIQSYSNEGLRTIALAYGDFPAKTEWTDAPDKDYILIGILAIQDPLRPEVTEAVEQCKKAGIVVRMLTGDNIHTAKSIAKDCKIFTEGGIAIEGPDFRKLSDEEIDKLLPCLSVIARCSPQDKYRLVKRLKEMGEVVAVTGDGTNDAPQLKEAHVGFAMGIQGTEVAKEASDIILLDDNFSSIVKAVLWGRNVFDSIRKFVQFQLTVNFVAVIIAFIGAVSNGESPLKPVQMLWVNLIMDTLAALALATARPHRSLLDRKPYGRTEGIITPTMWRNIVGQAIYQLCVLFSLLYFIQFLPFFELSSISSPEDKLVQTTIIFNTFVFCQLFNEINCTKLGNEFNPFAGIFSNRFFISILTLTTIVQILFIQFGGEFVQVTPLNSSQWIGCLVLASGSLVWGFFLRLIPPEVFSSFFPSKEASKSDKSKRQVRRVKQD